MKIIQTGKIFEVECKNIIHYICKIKNTFNNYHPILFLLDNNFYLPRENRWTLEELKEYYIYTNQIVSEKMKKKFQELFKNKEIKIVTFDKNWVKINYK